MTKYTIEIQAPDNMDPSTILDLAQEFALELFDDYPDQDDEGEDIELDEDEKEAIRVEVSVQEVTKRICKFCAREHPSDDKGVYATPTCTDGFSTE